MQNIEVFSRVSEVLRFGGFNKENEKKLNNFFDLDLSNEKKEVFLNIKPFFNPTSNKLSYLNFIFFASREQNSRTRFFPFKKLEFDSELRLPDEIILKNCEKIPETILCNIFEDMFNQHSFSKNNLKRVRGLVENWYSQQEYRLSMIKSIKVSENNEKISYCFDIKEPKIKSFAVVSRDKNSKNLNFFSQKFKTILFSNILGFSIGRVFKIDTKAWERLRGSSGIHFIDFSMNDYNLSDFGHFSDITMKITKTPSLAIEPEITFTGKNLSSSLSFTEKNFLGAGISIKQKIFLKKLNPHYMSFEINNRSLEKPAFVSIFGKYLKNFFSMGIVFKKYQNIEKTRFYKLSFGSERIFSRNPLKNGLCTNFLKSSFTLSYLNLLGNHSFFNYFSLEKLSRFFETKNSLLLNSVIDPVFKELKLNGIILVLENDCKNSTTLLDRKPEAKNKFFRSVTKEFLTTPTEKFVCLNTILSKSLNILVTLNCFDNIGFDCNPLKKFEIKLEMGKIFSFLVCINNYGKINVSFN